MYHTLFRIIVGYQKEVDALSCTVILRIGKWAVEERCFRSSSESTWLVDSKRRLFSPFTNPLNHCVMLEKVSETLLQNVWYVAYVGSRSHNRGHHLQWWKINHMTRPTHRWTLWIQRVWNRMSTTSLYQLCQFIPVLRCCACPQTKSARDDCFLRYDPSEAEGKCIQELQNHLACMRGLGFKV